MGPGSLTLWKLEHGGPLRWELGPLKRCHMRWREREEMSRRLLSVLGQCLLLPPTQQEASWHGACHSQLGKAEEWLAVSSPCQAPSFSKNQTLKVSLRVCQWVCQANNTRVVFNETPLPPPSETNIPKVHLAFSALDLPLCRDDEASFQGWCLWMRRKRKVQE